MVFTKLLLGNALAIPLRNYDAASEPLLPEVARCLPVLSSRHIRKCAARVFKRSCQIEQQMRDKWNFLHHPRLTSGGKDKIYHNATD